MSESPKSQNDKLWKLAKELDESPDSENNSDENSGLGGQQQIELHRFQDALNFLNEVRGDFEKAERKEVIDFDLRPPLESIETVSLVGGATLGAGQAIVPDDSLPDEKQIDRYSIKRLLGQGGFAKVFLAHDPKLVRPVALKVLKPSAFFSEEASARFDREARAAAVLNHPNIVPVFETGIAGSHRFIVSAYFEAESLEHWFKERDKRIEPELAARFIATLADATEHAHQRGVIHRDLKPANVLVQSESTGEFELRITDFGLAKHQGSIDQLRTSEGAVVGTPAYMSPEQAQGSSNTNGATDTYSLGVMLFELLTGELPILGETHIDTLLAIRTEEPKPLPRSVPKDLRAVCLKCLSKEPEGRYGSAFELAEDLRRWTCGKSVKARHVSQVERLKKWCVRNPALTVALVGMAAGLAFSLVQWQRAETQGQRAETHWQRSQSETVRAQEQTLRAKRSIDLNQSTIRELVVDISNSRKIPAELRRTLIARAAESQKLLLKEDPENEYLILQLCFITQQYAAALCDVEKFELAESVVDESLVVLEPLMQGEPRDARIERGKTEIMNLLKGRKATCLVGQKKFEEAKELLLEVVKKSPSDLHLANNYRISANSCRHEGDNTNAYLNYQKSYLTFQGLDKSDVFVGAEYALLLYDFARFEAKLERLPEAESLYEESLEHQTGVANSLVGHDESGRKLNQIKADFAELKIKQGEFEEAEELVDGLLDEIDLTQTSETQIASVRDHVLRLHRVFVHLESARGNDLEAASRLADFQKAYFSFGEYSRQLSWAQNVAYFYATLAPRIGTLEREEQGSFFDEGNNFFEAAMEEFPETDYIRECKGVLEQNAPK